MAYLLDTHVWLWLMTEPSKIGDRALRALSGQPKVLSVASLWELQIKHASGKLDLPMPLRELVKWTVQGEVRLLPVEERHIHELGELPPVHRDPFDRILVAQARSEGLKLATHDATVREYDVPLLWAGT